MRHFSRVGKEFGMMVVKEQNFEVEPGYRGKEGATKYSSHLGILSNYEVLQFSSLTRVP